MRRASFSIRSDSGFIVLAMGKYGAGELNYSSDIDLIVLVRSGGASRTRCRRRSPSSCASRATSCGFCRSAPRTVMCSVLISAFDPIPARRRSRSRRTPLSPITSARAKPGSARLSSRRAPRAGDIEAGENVPREISLSCGAAISTIAAIADVHAMKRQMHAFRGHDEIAVEGHNIKLGRGGIREIEFFVQTQQLIAGGRSPGLRGRKTLPMLDALTRPRAGSTR